MQYVGTAVWPSAWRLLRPIAMAGVFFLLSVPAFPAACNHHPTALEESVFQETNLLRSNPRAYAQHLDALRRQYQGRKRMLPEGIALITQEGVRAVDEAVSALHRASAVPLLQWQPCLSQMAFDHVRDIGPKGLLSHESSQGDSFARRIGRHGLRYRMASENISFGSPAGRDVVIDLLIDDGAPQRGHRKNLLDPEPSLTGVACGAHATYRTVCVMEYANGERP